MFVMTGNPILSAPRATRRLWMLLPVCLSLGACVGTDEIRTASIDGGRLGAVNSESGRRLIQRGAATWYQSGARTANGERFNPDGLTAAHRTLPFGTRVRVLHEASGRSVVVRINDRGPFTRGKIIDLSRGSARALGLRSTEVVSLHRLD